MLHLCKLSVGVREVTQLQELQAARLRNDPPLRHQTRNFPRRAKEILAGGSMYWVVGGVMQVRQRILDIQDATWDDGSPCAALLLDPSLVQVAGRPMRAFQGWRYLEAAAAPPDVLSSHFVSGELDMPDTMRRDLRALCLL